MENLTLTSFFVLLCKALSSFLIFGVLLWVCRYLATLPACNLDAAAARCEQQRQLTHVTRTELQCTLYSRSIAKLRFVDFTTIKRM